MLHTRRYGASGPPVVVLHGGPGAPGYMAPVARGLEDAFRVVEPFQRASGGAPLTVDRHVEDLHDLLDDPDQGARPALIGSSWGAMLALAFAAAHPERAGPLALVGCGTFDAQARVRFKESLESRIGAALRNRLDRLPLEIRDPNLRLQVMGDLLLPAYSYDLTESHLGTEACDARAFQETWDDMVRLQEAGTYPAAFAAIRSPVLMLYGADDPHPGRMIRASLVPFLPQLDYREWPRCGHYPWLEREVREEFFSVLRGWLFRHGP